MFAVAALLFVKLIMCAYLSLVRCLCNWWLNYKTWTRRHWLWFGFVYLWVRDVHLYLCLLTPWWPDLTGTPGAQSLDKIYPRKVLFRQRWGLDAQIDWQCKGGMWMLTKWQSCDEFHTVKWQSVGEVFLCSFLYLFTLTVHCCLHSETESSF